MSNEIWRQRLDRALQRLPDDTPAWAKSLADVLMETSAAQIAHTDANTRMALQEQDERLKDAISEMEGRLTERMDGLEGAVRLHDGAFEVMEQLLEQNNRLITRIAWGLATLALIVLLEAIVFLGGAVLRPHEVVWALGAGAALAGAALIAWMWRRRPRP